MNDRQRSEAIRKRVRERYSRVARQEGSSCCQAASCCGSSSCCGDSVPQAERLGYTAEELRAAPAKANLFLGCGNPSAIAALKAGETVLDLGSGGGLDCFLAARQVGDSGRVIGVDMTPEMVAAARANAAQAGYTNVEFRLGEIEHIPVADDSVDVIISNCVINLSPDKQAVFEEAYRVLKPGGRLAISDMVSTAPLPAKLAEDMALWSDCLAGAALVKDLEAMLREAGFVDIHIRPQQESGKMVDEWAPGRGLEDYILSATIEGHKPAIPDGRD